MDCDIIQLQLIVTKNVSLGSVCLSEVSLEQSHLITSHGSDTDHRTMMLSSSSQVISVRSGSRIM